ncbi:hypothetical protein LXA43DRAFT_942610 [Ganoderma leucocontextum]|nr:hypothetical protein LXA43DRAFT_942610 [Ganoderma leucocontextum]
MNLLPELQHVCRAQAIKTLKPVSVIHPGCRQLIFALPAFPYPATTGTKMPMHGVDHRVVLDACRILTNYAAEEQEGYISKDRAGRHPILRHSEVLAPDEYYYHPAPPATRTEANYPIVTDFAAWKFPDKIPDHWTRPESHTSEQLLALRRKYTWSMPNDIWYQVTSGDGGCVVTKYLSCACPMAFAGPGDRTGIHDPANRLTLCLDLGRLFERHGLVFFPTPVEGKFMAYLCRWNLDYVEPFHRRLVTISPRVSEEFLYARFAHTMIKLVNTLPDSHLNPFPIPEGVKPSKKECE